MHPVEMGTQKSALIAMMRTIRGDVTEPVGTVGMEKHMCAEYVACKNQVMKFIIVNAGVVHMYTAEAVFRK